MPVYEYECRKCAKRFEVERGFHETGGGKCPACGREGQRVYHAPPLLFKGSGFYITDHRKKTGDGEEGESKARPPTETKAENAEKTSTSKKEPK